MTQQDVLNISLQDWEQTFDAITDFVSVLDREFRILKVNRALAEFLKTTPEKLIGRHCYEIMHGRTSNWDGCPHERMLIEKRPVTLEVDDPYIGVPLLVTASPIFNDNGDLIGSVHVATDVSFLKTMQNNLTIRNRQMEALNNLSRQAIRNHRLSEVIPVALAGIEKACSPDLTLFYLKKGQWLELHGVLPENSENLNEKKLVGECLCGLAAEEGTPVFSNDIHQDGRCTLSECKDAGMRSFAALPLVLDGSIIGVIGMASRAERDFSVERPFLEILTATVSVVCQNSFLIEKLEEQSGLLEDKVSERTEELEKRNSELERLNRLFVDRELRMLSQGKNQGAGAEGERRER
ncbi:MAG: GAF domain-containing protein [Proteobacteria bacterium]|nr:GAF domain-containing protein [Pseudomonadota bacterium]MBU1708981.1 GAF domain-containing protein [Pseudomonadota bacterium]